MQVCYNVFALETPTEVPSTEPNLLEIIDPKSDDNNRKFGRLHSHSDEQRVHFVRQKLEEIIALRKQVESHQNQAKRDKEILQRKLDRKIEEVNELHKLYYERMRDSEDGEIDKIGEPLFNFAHKKEDVELKVNELQQETLELVERVNELEQENKELTERMSELEQEDWNQKAQIEDLIVEVNELQQEADKQKTQNKELTEKLQLHEDFLATIGPTFVIQEIISHFYNLAPDSLKLWKRENTNYAIHTNSMLNRNLTRRFVEYFFSLEPSLSDYECDVKQFISDIFNSQLSITIN